MSDNGIDLQRTMGCAPVLISSTQHWVVVSFFNFLQHVLNPCSGKGFINRHKTAVLPLSTMVSVKHQRCGS
jgi:hypothetical protein